MALFENFPYTDLHQLNLDWLINEIKKIESTQVLSVNGQTGEVILYQDAQMLLPSVTDDHWSIGRITDGTYRGIMFGNDDKAYIVHGNQMAQLYGVNNPPAYPVTSVNGQTGDIVLYASAAVQLPSLSDTQLHNWNIFRDLNGVMRGIQFDDTGKAYIIDGTNRFELYAENNPAHKEASVQLPGVSGATLDNWNIWRNLNNTASGIQFNDDGSVSVILGSNRYSVYTSNNPPPYPVTSVNGQTGAVSLNIPNAFVTDPSLSELTIAEDIPDASVWALLRETENGYVGISVNNGVNPGAYLQIGTGASAQKIKLLTNDDIPSSSGVVSINGLTGVVSINGTNLDVSGTDTRKINVVLSGLETDVSTLQDMDDYIKDAMMFDENGHNIASNNIPAGNFVFWNNRPYIASMAIATGDTLSDTNLLSIPSGGFSNILKEAVTPVQIPITPGPDALAGASLVAYKIGKLLYIQGNGEATGHNTWTNYTIATIPTEYNMIWGGCIGMSNHGQTMFIQTAGHSVTYRPLGIELTESTFRFTTIAILS